MRIRPQARDILARALPDRLDSLWCEVLDSAYGASLLEAWDLTAEQLRSTAPVIEHSSESLLQWSLHHSFLNSPLCTAEAVAEDLFTGRRDWQGPPLADFTGGDVEYHEVDIREVFNLAFEDGLEEAQERHYLQAAQMVWPALNRIMEFSTRPVASFAGPYHPIARDGPVGPAQLALACLRRPELIAWMGSLGVCEWRLHTNLLVSAQLFHYSYDRTHWLRPACQEAHRLGALEVGLDHLFLALLGELQGLTSRVLCEAGVDLRMLRCQLAGKAQPSAPVCEMRFSPRMLAIFQACSKDNQAPCSGVLLQALLEAGDYPLIPRERVLSSLQRRLDGLLPEDPSQLSLDRLRLGMTEEQVLLQLGPPRFRKETCWMYRDTSVRWLNSRVQGVIGYRLTIDGLNQSLCLDSDMLQAEEILGASRLWHGGPGPAWALIAGGKVKMLTLSLDG